MTASGQEDQVVASNEIKNVRGNVQDLQVSVSARMTPSTSRLYRCKVARKFNRERAVSLAINDNATLDGTDRIQCYSLSDRNRSDTE